MTGPDLARAGERLRRQLESLREVRNAGARDQRFKVWRQDTLTLLQRLWPGDHVKAERFRRIPFSAPAARAGVGTREYFERGCKEAEVYLEGLAIELGVQGGPAAMGDEHDVEAAPAPGSAWTGPEVDATARPAREEPAPGFVIPPVPAAHAGQVPHAGHDPLETPSAGTQSPVIEPAAEPAPPPPPPAPRKPITFKPASSAYETLPISFLGPDRRKTERPAGSEGPSRRREDVPAPPASPPPAVYSVPPAASSVPPPAASSSTPTTPAVVSMPPSPPSPASPPPPASAAPSPPSEAAADDAAPAKPRSKMRLKDMLGFGDTPPAGVEPVTPHAPAPAAPSAPGVRVEVPMPPAQAMPPAPIRPPASRPPEAEDPADPRTPQRDYAAEFILESPVLQSRAHPLKHRVQETEEGVEPPAISPVASPRASMEPPPVAPAVPAPRPEPQVIPMPVRQPEVAFIEEEPMEPELPPGLAAEEIYELATRVLEYGVPPAHAAILKAALIDLGRQLENPPIRWTALRETIAFAMDYPELARRLLPRLLPYLSQAA